MTKIAERLADRLAGVPAYQPGLPGTGALARKLSSNEAPLGPGPRIVAALRAAADGVNRYPEELELHLELAAELGIAPESLLLTNGSDELCSLVAGLFLAPGDVAVAGAPCYQIDRKVTLLAGASLTQVPLVEGRHDLAAMAAAAAGAAVVWLPTPHNPTGAAVRPDELREFLARVPESCLVVVDEAYRSFADAEYQVDAARLVAEHPNVLVQRTLSKDWAIAGLRLGYGVGAPEVVDALRRTREPFSVSVPALAAGRAGLGAPAWREMGIARVREGRAQLEAELDAVGVEYVPSQANFVLVRVPHSRIAGPLAAAGISVRPGEDLGLPGWVRVTIGWAPVMAELRRILRAELAGAG